MSRRSGSNSPLAQQWWSQRLTTVLESYGLGARMERGRRYARSERVLSLTVQAGLLEARVQGSRVSPYRVQVRCTPAGDMQWCHLEAQLATQLGWTAQLLNGALPREMEQACQQAGIQLLPQRWRDLNSRCSCPDDAVPCKHIAAVLYVFAARLDEDPWLLLRWQGRERERLLEQLRPAPPQVLSHLPPWWPEGLRAQPQQHWLMPQAEPPLQATAALAQLGPLSGPGHRSLPLADALEISYRTLLSGDSDPESDRDRPDSSDGDSDNQAEPPQATLQN
ncbi:MAG: SWIM zinc finger family protein [Cyanobium sp.]